MIATRRQGLAAATTALAALALAVAVAGRGCDRGDGPEAAVEGMLAAAQAGDRAALLGWLGPATRARLDTAAAQATALVGDGRGFSATDLVAIGGPVVEPAAIEIEHRDGDRADLILIDDHGARTRVTAVRVDGAWRIELVSGAAFPGPAP